MLERLLHFLFERHPSENESFQMFNLRLKIKLEGIKKKGRARCYGGGCWSCGGGGGGDRSNLSVSDSRIVTLRLSEIVYHQRFIHKTGSGLNIHTGVPLGLSQEDSEGPKVGFRIKGMAKRKIHSENYTGTSPPGFLFDVF